MSQNNDSKEQSRRIIVIDDNPDIHKDFSTILLSDTSTYLESLESELFGQGKVADAWESPHFQLDYASQGQIGYEKIKEACDENRPYQLAFVDMRMPPGWDGLKTIDKIWKVDSDIQVVLCTAYSDYSWDEINRCLKKTDNLLILKKPFDSTEVFQLASTLTTKWHLAKQAKMKHDELEKIVAERTHELQLKNLQLQEEITKRKNLEEQLVRSQKMEAMGTLAAGVAHDLNNILSGILTYPDLLLLKIPESDPMYRPLTVIKRSGHKAAAIVQDMLTFARRNISVKNPVDMSEIVNNFLETPECLLIKQSHRDIAIEHDTEAAVFPVLGSAVHLEKLVMNLITNAVESMESGGTVTISLSQTTLDESLPGYSNVNPGDYVKLTISDEGSGIAQDDLSQIFEPFFTKKKLGNSGTGLGMTVVWDTVENHDGYIEVESKINQGTTISIYLPAAQENDVTHEVGDSTGNLQGQGERILVVDDVAEQREIATEIFRQLGYLVDAVPSGESALEFIKVQNVDLLLLDMVMDPGIDGLETLQRVLSINPEQKVIVASGYTNSNQIRSAIKLGANFLHKPYQLNEIAQSVRDMLGDSRELCE